MTYIAIYNDNYLAHHGVKGMKWGVRRSRTARLYSDGSGRRARGSSSSGEMTAEQRSARRRKIAKGIAIGVGSAAAAAGLAYAGSKYLKSDRGQQMLRNVSASANRARSAAKGAFARGGVDRVHQLRRKAGNYANAAKGFASTAKNTAKTYAKSSNITRTAKAVSKALDRNIYGRQVKRTAAFVAPAAATAAGAYAGNKVNQAIKNRKKKRR